MEQANVGIEKYSQKEGHVCSNHEGIRNKITKLTPVEIYSTSRIGSGQYFKTFKNTLMEYALDLLIIITAQPITRLD